MLLNTNTFLDYLLKHQIINKVEASFLKQKYVDISKIVELLIAKNITNYESVSKISAEILNIPFVKLEGKEVDLGTLSIIPIDLSQKYGIVSFEKTANNIKVAVARPYLLQSSDIGVAGWLKNIDKGIYKFTIVASTLNDVASLIKTYQEKAQAVSTSSQINSKGSVVTSNLPTIDLSNHNVSFDTISIFPEEISRKYQVVVFEKVSESSLRVGLVDPNDPNTQKTIKFIENKNNIFIEQYQISQKDFDILIKFFKLVSRKTFKKNLIPLGQMKLIQKTKIKVRLKQFQKSLGLIRSILIKMR